MYKLKKGEGKMKKIMSLVIILTVSIFILTIAIPSLADLKQNSKKPLSLKQNSKKLHTVKSNKVKNFLRIVNNATTMDAIYKAYNRSAFSKKEQVEVGKKLAAPPYSTKLNLLKRGMISKMVSKSETTKRRLLNKHNIKLKQSGERNIKRKNQLVFNTINQLKSKSKKITIRSMTGEMKNLLSMADRLNTNSEEMPSISRVSPNPANPGDRITISGDRFGSGGRTGMVKFLFGSLYIDLTIKKWRNSIIEVVIPSELMDYEGGIMEGEIWVKRKTDQRTVRKDFSISIPAPPPVSMSITTIVPSDLSPGQQFVIMGDGFLDTEGRSVKIYLNSVNRNINCEVISWTNSYIHASLPDSMSGFTSCTANVEVVNSDRDQTEQNNIVNVEPNIVVEVLSERLLYENISSSTTTSNEEVWEDIELQNDWVANDVYIDEITALGFFGQSGARIIQRPEAGSQNLRTIVELLAPGTDHGISSTISCYVYCVIQGPEGVANQ